MKRKAEQAELEVNDAVARNLRPRIAMSGLRLGSNGGISLDVSQLVLACLPISSLGAVALCCSAYQSLIAAHFRHVRSLTVDREVDFLPPTFYHRALCMAVANCSSLRELRVSGPRK